MCSTQRVRVERAFSMGASLVEPLPAGAQAAMAKTTQANK